MKKKRNKRKKNKKNGIVSPIPLLSDAMLSHSPSFSLRLTLSIASHSLYRVSLSAKKKRG